SITFRDPGFPDPTALVRYVQSRPLDFKARPDGKLIVSGEWPEAPARLKALKAFLETLSRLVERAVA
ncbi:MAG: hypothetical protein ABUS57_22160, partial [Pseudomonadota bacterium]